MGLFSKFIAKIKGTNGFAPADWKELEEHLGIDRGKITLVLQGKIPHTQGFHFIRK